MQGGAGQYVLQKRKMGDILRRVRATDIPVAVIDSEIDDTHPDLEGTVIDRFDATGVEEKPHSHGTGMAGASSPPPPPPAPPPAAPPPARRSSSPPPAAH